MTYLGDRLKAVTDMYDRNLPQIRQFCNKADFEEVVVFVVTTSRMYLEAIVQF